MRTISYKLDDLKKVVIPIGYEGENNHTRVIIDAGEVFKQYPEAAVALTVQPPKGTMYPAIVTRDGDTVTWDVKDSDCASNGNGEAQFTFTNDTVVVKSVVTKIKVQRSLHTEGPAPDPILSWLDTASETLEEADQAIEAATEAAAAAEAAAEDLEALDDITKAALAGDVGKALSPKTVENGVVTEWQFVEPGAGTEDYTDLDNKPSIAGVTLSGNKTLEDLGIAADDDLDNLADEVSDVKTAIHGVEYAGKLLKNPVKSALLNLFDHVVFSDGNAQIYIDALKEAWQPDGTLDSISAVFTQGSAVIYTTDSLDVLRQYLVVTGIYIKDSVEFTDEITDYTLSGTLTEGTSTITVTYGEETATFTVTVTTQSDIPSAYQKVEYIGSTGSDAYIIFDEIAPDTLNEIIKYEFDIDFKFDEWTDKGSNSNIIASFNTSAGGWIGYNKSVNAICMGTSSGCYFTDNNPTTRHSYHYSVNIHSWTGKLERDDNESIERNFTQDTFTDKGFCLFSGATSISSRSQQYDFAGKIYGFSMTYNGAPLLELVPCYRKSDNVIGFYDKVGNTFYTNTGSGTFTKGSDVNV